MKKYLLPLLFGITLSLSAQTDPPPSFFIHPIEGQGIGPEDNEYITEIISHEILARNYFLSSSPFDTDYLIFGNIYYVDFNEDWYSPQSYILDLALRDPRTGRDMIEQQLLYSSLDDLDYFFPLIMFNMMSMFGEVHVGEIIDDSWRNKEFYLGLSAFWSPRIYIGDDTSFHYRNFGGGIFAKWHFLDFLSFMTGAEVVNDWIRLDFEDFQDLLLEIPLALKFIFKPSSHFMIGTYGGIKINIPLLNNITDPSLFSWIVGVQYGVRAGPGVFLVDPRFSMDLTRSTLHSSPTTTYQRYVMQISLGYKFGFF